MTRTRYPQRTWTPSTAKANALKLYRDCTYAEWEPGLNRQFKDTIVVLLWSDRTSYRNRDEPRHITAGYVRAS